jgi:methionine synthase II (cobalamin-independent)
MEVVPVSLSRWDIFLTHDWGYDELGRWNHERVARIAAELTALGFRVWFDGEQMRGDITKKMAEGIDGSACVLIFVTLRYINKASGDGENGDVDNWYVWATEHAAPETPELLPHLSPPTPPSAPPPSLLPFLHSPWGPLPHRA